MKKLILLFFGGFILNGCATMDLTTEFVNPPVGIEKSAGVSDIFFEYQSPVHRYDLTIVGLNEKEITLHYAEYFISGVNTG